MTPILSLVMNTLKAKSPTAFNDVNQAIQNGISPEGIAKQIFPNMNPQIKEQVIKQAGQMGCPKEILTQIQNMK